MLAAASPTAFGNGDVYVGSGGGIRIAASAPVTIAARYTQLDNTTLELDIDIDGNGGRRLRVGGSFTVAGGTLHVKFVNGYTPKAGDTIALIDGGAGSAQFSTVTIDGFEATPVYTATDASITLSAACRGGCPPSPRSASGRPGTPSTRASASA